MNLGILNPEDSSWIYCRWWFEQTVLMVLSTQLHDDTPLCGSYSTPPFFHWMISSLRPTDHLFSKDQKMESDAESSLKLRVCDIFTHIYIYTYIIYHIYIYMHIQTIHTGMPPHLIIFRIFSTSCSKRTCPHFQLFNLLTSAYMDLCLIL